MAAKILLLLSGLVFAGVGLTSLVSPQTGVDPLGLQLVTINSLNEIRANYGGMHLLLGLFMLGGAVRDIWQRQALLIIALFTGGLVLGRVTSLLVDGTPDSVILSFLLIEAVGCLWATALLLRTPASATGS